MYNIDYFLKQFAFATVGLAKDLTPHLKDITKVFIIILMFIGRVGPLTIIFFFYNKVTGRNLSIKRKCYCRIGDIYKTNCCYRLWKIRI